MFVYALDKWGEYPADERVALYATFHGALEGARASYTPHGRTEIQDGDGDVLFVGRAGFEIPRDEKGRCDHYWWYKLDYYGDEPVYSITRIEVLP